ncbi:MAG TPA: hypothetical protein VF844_22570 [Ktedonobacteraceae bacterium]
MTRPCHPERSEGPGSTGFPRVSAHAQHGQPTARHAVDGSGAGRGRLGSRVAGGYGAAPLDHEGEGVSRPLLMRIMGGRTTNCVE